MYTEYSKTLLGNRVMRRTMSFLILLYSLSCGSAWADLHTTGSYGLANGSVYDGLWYSIGVPDDGYATEGTLSIGGPPVYGDVLYYSEPADGEFYVASEVGITEEGVYYATAHAEASSPWGEPWLGTPSTYSWSGGSGAIGFTIDIDDGPLVLHWIEEGFEEYEAIGWQIQLDSLNFSPEGTWVNLVYQTDFDQELLSEGIQLIDLPLADAYQLSWSIGIYATTPGDHGWSQLSLDLEVVPLPSAVILGILGLGMAGMKLRKKT